MIVERGALTFLRAQRRALLVCYNQYLSVGAPPVLEFSDLYVSDDETIRFAMDALFYMNWWCVPCR